MSELSLQSEAPQVCIDADGTIHVVRRRPGRQHNIDATLIPLLRNTGASSCELTEINGEAEAEIHLSPDDGNIVKGIAYCTAFGLALWAAVAYLFLHG